MDHIRNFAPRWAKAKPSTKTTMIQSLYEEIVVRVNELVSVRLMPEARFRGLAHALPQEFVVLPMRTRGARKTCGHWRARQESIARMP